MRSRSGSGSASTGTLLSRINSNTIGTLSATGLLTVPSMAKTNPATMVPALGSVATGPAAGGLLDPSSTSSSVAWFPDGRTVQPSAQVQASVPLPVIPSTTHSHGGGERAPPKPEPMPGVTEGVRSQLVSTTLDPPGNSGYTTEPYALQNLESRHTLLMRDIEDLEDRFDDIAASLIGPDE